MFKTVTVLAIAIAPCVADVQIKTSYNADGQNAETTIWSDGQRMRYDYGSGVVMLRFCDQQKMVQIDDKSKSYLVLPAQEASQPAGAAKPEVTDTGEHKTLFGYPARHLKIVEVTEGKDGKKERSETDGWYLDLQGLGACFGAAPGMAYRGYPASYTITTYGENGKPANKVSMQIVNLAEAPLGSNLFAIPGDYKDATPPTIPKAGAPKTPGAIRIGALSVRDKSVPGGHNDALFGRLVTQLMEARLDLVELKDGPQEAIDSKAQATGCDLVLYTEVASIEKPAAGKVTGLLHKAPGIGHVTGGDGMEAHVNYRLAPAGGGTAVLAASAVAKAGTQVNVKGAVMLASNFLPMAMGARMFSGALNPTMMNALVSGRGMGASMATADPMMGGLTSVLRAVMPGQGPQGGDALSPQAQEAVAAAIDMEGKAIIAQVKSSTR